MKLTITLPDDVARLVRRLPNPEEFVSRAVEKALAQEAIPPIQPEAGRSKWKQIVERIERNPTSLGDYYEQFNRDRAEFRKELHFEHDEP